MSHKETDLSMLRNLNSVQRQAVEKSDGPNLILAGAGSGKTRVLTHKIAYLIKRKAIPAYRILAMTFTNKAAREMKERVEALLKDELAEMWIGTFHSIFARILRRECEKLGYQQNFVIYDEADQLTLIKTIIADSSVPDMKAISPQKVKSRIKQYKNANLNNPSLMGNPEDYEDGLILAVYKEYVRQMLQNNAMDFEDLLLRSIELFVNFPLVLQYYQKHFQYILVDEYQDTNRAQYELIKLLSREHRNISVVGDDDQSIYRWRGAEVKNILDFESDFPDCTIFRMEQNYRSTSTILAIAHSIIQHNVNRMEKQLWTKNGTGEKVGLFIARDATGEAHEIIRRIEYEIHQNQRNFCDFAILYRTNAQSRALEEAFQLKGISYVVVGGVRFYERKEIKDVLAYLRVLVNPSDSISIKRIINYPARGIGDATIKKIDRYCSLHGISFFTGLESIKEIDGITSRTQQAILQFVDFMKKYDKLKSSIEVGELIAAMVDELGIIATLRDEGTIEAKSRIENIRELIAAINDFVENNPHLNLEHYLENVALISDVDNWESAKNSVSLLTLHSAKGLEFPVVFISGMEEGLFPLSRQLSNDDDIEEERRLFYVGATRAKEKLYLTAAFSRNRYGENSSGALSRFLHEIDKELIEREAVSNQDFAQTRSRTFKPRKVIKFASELNETRHSGDVRPGILVRHPHFGKGVVKSIEGEGNELKAYIIFEDVGEKKVMLKFCKLEIL
ncbi:MAG: ATP-dependent helicase [Candidatus Zhuqueibacterota bacterium]